MIFYSTFITKFAEANTLLATDPFNNFAKLFKGWTGPGKLLVAALAGLAVVLWSALHATGGETAKRNAKSGWLAAGIAAVVAYAAVSVVSFLTSQSSKNF